MYLPHRQLAKPQSELPEEEPKSSILMAVHTCLNNEIVYDDDNPINFAHQSTCRLQEPCHKKPCHQSFPPVPAHLQKLESIETGRTIL